MKETMGFIPSVIGLFCVAVSSCAGANVSVKVHGTIVEAACAIDVGSRDQTIEMGSLPISSLYRDGQGPIRPFHIRLVNCVLARQNPAKPNWQYFRVTFDGAQSHGLFRVDGQAAGVGLQIQRADGEIALPGKAMSRQSLSEGERELSYRLRLVANHEALAAGEHTSQLRFKLDYE